MLDIVGNFLLGLVVALTGYIVIFGLVVLIFRLGKAGPLVIDPRKHTGPPSRWLLFFYLVILAFSLGMVIATVALDISSRSEFGRVVVTYLDYAKNWALLLVVAAWSWISWKSKKIKLG